MIPLGVVWDKGLSSLEVERIHQDRFRRIHLIFIEDKVILSFLIPFVDLVAVESVKPTVSTPT